MVPIPAAWRRTCRLCVAITTPVVEGALLSKKDIMAWLTDKLYHNEVGGPRAWARAVTCVRFVPRAKYEEA